MKQAPKKHQVILLFSKQVVSDVYSIAFENVYDLSAIVCTSAEDAIREMRKRPEACLLAEFSLASAAIVEIVQTRQRFARQGLVVMLGGGPERLPPEAQDPDIKFLPESATLSDVAAQAEQCLSLRAASQQYCRLSLKTLLERNERLRCEVYIKLSDDKYVNVLHAEDRFELPEFERFRAKGVEHLYLRREDFFSVMDDLLKKAQALAASPATSDDEAIQASSAIFDLVQNAFHVEGFTPQVRQLAESSISLAVQSAKRKGPLSLLLARLDSSRDTYLNWHTTALSFLACKMATLQGWESDSTFYKLSLAAILHDLPLGRDELAALQTRDEITASGLSDAEKVQVLKHPIDAARLAATIEETASGVGFILEQHHERQDGSGFPAMLDHKDISPISALFIISHDIVDTMFKSPPQNFDIQKFLDEREQQQSYTRGNYGKVFRVLAEKRKEL